MALPLYTETLNLDTINWTEVKVPLALGGAANGMIIENTDLMNSVKRRTDKALAATEVTIGPTVEKPLLPPPFGASRMPTNQIVCHLQAAAGAPVVKVTWF